MSAETKIIIRDVFATCRSAAQLIAMTSGAIVLVAVGLALTGIFLGQSGDGVRGFFMVMSLDGYGQSTPVSALLHNILVSVNWIVLVGLSAFLALQIVRNYRASVLERASAARAQKNARGSGKSLRTIQEVAAVQKASNF